MTIRELVDMCDDAETTLNKLLDWKRLAVDADDKQIKITAADLDMIATSINKLRNTLEDFDISGMRS